MTKEAIPQSTIGLCEQCTHARTNQNARGSVFYQCQLSKTDPSFAKYPRLPVLSCPGYVKRDSIPHARHS